MLSFVVEQEVDGETLFYMNDLNLLKPFKLSYKNQIIFLKEREKLFSSKTNEKPTSPLTSNDTALLIIDENHHFMNGTPAQQRDVIQALKNIGTKLQISIIGVGIKDAALVLGTDPQLSSRFDIIRLFNWELDKTFRGLLNAFEKHLPLKKSLNLVEKEKVKDIKAKVNDDMNIKAVFEKDIV